MVQERRRKSHVSDTRGATRCLRLVLFVVLVLHLDDDLLFVEDLEETKPRRYQSTDRDEDGVEVVVAR